MTEPRSFACELAGTRTELVVTDVGISLGGSAYDWLDVDDVTYGAHSLTFHLPDASTVTAERLGGRSDECARRVRELRGAARRPALTQSALAPLAAFEVRIAGPDPSRPPVVTDVLLFPHTLTVEPRSGPSATVPLPLVASVERDGYAFTLALRGLPTVVLRGFGARTDEFAERLNSARTALEASTAAAYGEYAPALAGLRAPDGWAVQPSAAGALWPLLAETWRSLSRGSQAAALADLCGEDRLRLGLWTEGGTVRMPFMLASSPGTGPSARVAVEAVDADDRATFVFATDDVDRLNAALVLTAFRREALSLPDAELGRWAVAVRTQPVVRWARERLVARVVHDPGWPAAVRGALTT